ncbi:secretory calcium-binding phosphoprotein proline-glutamine rich 1 [Castor canadensis]|uniref:Secretory calcium-binding phosphoprotein proline-glutamine rich 1 n=1 Tax=Castor canadensis TaxID=51338 RepID=A0AC58JYZ3_CASCN
MKLLILAGLLSTATALPIPFEQSGGSSSEQRFHFYPQIPSFFSQFPFSLSPQLIPIPFPFLYDTNQLITSILNQLGVSFMLL